MKKNKNKIILCIVIILIIILGLIYYFNKDSKNNITNEKANINASQIWRKYDKDPDKDTPTYDGDYVEAVGVITYKGKDDHGTPSIEIADKKNGKSYVLAVFNTFSDMDQVSVGDTVKVSGYFHIMSSHNKVVIKKSKILKIYK